MQCQVFTSSQEDQRQVGGSRKCSQLLCQREAVAPRYGDVQHDQIGMLSNGHAQAADRIVRCRCSKAMGFEPDEQSEGGIQVIFDD